MSTVMKTIEPTPYHAWLSAELAAACAAQDINAMDVVARELRSLGVNDDGLAVMVAAVGGSIALAQDRDPDGYVEQFREAATQLFALVTTHRDIEGLPE